MNQSDVVLSINGGFSQQEQGYETNYSNGTSWGYNGGISPTNYDLGPKQLGRNLPHSSNRDNYAWGYRQTMCGKIIRWSPNNFIRNGVARESGSTSSVRWPMANGHWMPQNGFVHLPSKITKIRWFDHSFQIKHCLSLVGKYSRTDSCHILLIILSNLSIQWSVYPSVS